VEDNTAPIEGENADFILFPADDTYYIFATASDIFFQVGDNCGSATVTLDGCDSASDFTGSCSYDATSDKLYVQASRTNTEVAGRFYTVYGTATDECGNSAPISRQVWVPYAEEQIPEDQKDQCLKGTTRNKPDMR